MVGTLALGRLCFLFACLFFLDWHHMLGESITLILIVFVDSWLFTSGLVSSVQVTSERAHEGEQDVTSEADSLQSF